MFSGIVQGLGTVQRVTQHINVKTFYIAFDNCAKCSVGDSVAINGTCLTVTSFNLEHTIASFDAVPETLQRTTLDDLLVGDTVNTETAIRYG